MYNIDLMREKEDEYLLTKLKEVYILGPNNIILWNNDRPIDHFTTIGAYRSWKTRFMKRTLPGSVMNNGYKSLTFSVGGVKYQVLYHRAVYALSNNRWPVDLLDHNDGNSQNNSPLNLLESDATNNNRNRPLNKNSKSGILGVNWELANNKWRISGCVNSKFVHLGRSDDFFEACCLRKSWEIKEGYSINHGRRAS